MPGTIEHLLLKTVYSNSIKQIPSTVSTLSRLLELSQPILKPILSDLVEKGYDAGKIVKEVAKVTGGGGGGKARLAQAGGKDKDKLDEALRLVRKLI